MTDKPDWEKALDTYGAEAVDLSTIGDRTRKEWEPRPLRQLQDIAFAQMEQMERKMDALNVVRVGQWYWITDPDGNLRLACDTAPIATVKILGMEAVQRAYDEAKRQEHS